MNDPLFANKVAFSILATLLLLFGLPLLAESLYGGGGHHGGGDHHGEEVAAVFPQFPIELDIAGAAPSIEEAPVDLGTLLADASVAAGERGSALCAACHSFNKGGAQLQGPNLWNIVGREIASVDEYSGYSSALQAKEGAWTYEALDAFLYNSQEYVPGTAMAQKIKKDSKRADIIAYLGSLSDDPVPYPAPVAAEETAAPVSDDTGE